MTEEEELEAAAQRVAELWTARLEGQRSLPHILASNLLAVVACLLIFPGFGYAITRGSLRKQPHVFAIRLAFLFGPVIYVGGQEARVALALACDGLPCDFWYYAPLEALGIAAALLVPVGFYCVYGKESINSGSVRLDPSYVKYLSKHPALWVGSILMVVGAALIEAS